MPDEDFDDLNPDGQHRNGNIAVLAAGTGGLGKVIIARDGNAHHVIANEGGHADFAPDNKQEIELLKYLRGKYPFTCGQRPKPKCGRNNYTLP